jgi:hypothetical protein
MIGLPLSLEDTRDDSEHQEQRPKPSAALLLMLAVIPKGRIGKTRDNTPSFISLAWIIHQPVKP